MEYAEGSRGRKDAISTQGIFCSNLCCGYFRITDEQIHALVANGKHGRREVPGVWEEVCCSARHNPVPVEDAFGAGGCIGLAEAFGVREITIRT